METPDHPPRLGFGLVARPDPDPSELGSLGARLEALGYTELWANDGRGRAGLATLRAAAGSSRRLDLCLGVAPLSEVSPAQIAAEVARLELSPGRLVIGVGTGSGSSLAMVRDGVAALRELLPGVRLAIAALGPRMCHLGGEVADVVLLNWALPERIAWSRERICEGAEASGRPMPRVASYVRVALGSDAPARLAAEAERYRARPRSYRRLFAEQAVAAGEPPGIATADAAEVPALLAPYRAALDSCVVRALPAESSTEELLAIAAAAVMLPA
ncbi:MAG TPA: LLM class flavin-dependent oxidoreductase [Candidatus Limnocylindria bacterium]|nr:LLM class flavin-dependent oxidoreductase [Candidatus Limnocylindria bacterium]